MVVRTIFKAIFALPTRCKFLNQLQKLIRRKQKDALKIARALLHGVDFSCCVKNATKLSGYQIEGLVSCVCFFKTVLITILAKKRQIFAFLHTIKTHSNNIIKLKGVS